MDYWNETMQDDLYELSAEGWNAGKVVKRLEKKAKKKGGKDKKIPGIEGLEGSLITPQLIIQEYFSKEQEKIDLLQSDLDGTIAKMDELKEEHGGDEGLLTEAMNDKGNINKKSLSDRKKELGKRNDENKEELDMLESFKKLMEKDTALKAEIKMAFEDLETKVISQYPKLSIDEIESIVNTIYYCMLKDV